MKVLIKKLYKLNYNFIIFLIVLFLTLSPIESSAQTTNGTCYDETVCGAMENSCNVAGGRPEKRPIRPSGWSIRCHAKVSTTAPVSGPCTYTRWGDLPKCSTMAQNCGAIEGEHSMEFGTGYLAVCLLKVISYTPQTSPTESGPFVPLVGIPGIENPDVNFNKYINTLYAISISLAALLAVIKIIVAGVKWMLTDVVTSKQEAKKDIQGALIGLLIVISAVLILTVINPNLVNFDILPESETTP